MGPIEPTALPGVRDRLGTPRATELLDRTLDLVLNGELRFAERFRDVGCPPAEAIEFAQGLEFCGAEFDIVGIDFDQAPHEFGVSAEAGPAQARAQFIDRAAVGERMRQAGQLLEGVD